MVRPRCEVKLNNLFLTLTKTARCAKNSGELFHKVYVLFEFLQVVFLNFERKRQSIFCKNF